MRKSSLHIWVGALLLVGAMASVAAAASIKQAPLPAGASSSAFTAISCPTTVGCYAVGYTNSATGPQRGFAVHFTTHGIKPIAPKSPAGASGFALQDISCTSQSNCWGVGSSGTSSSTTTNILAEHWNGKAWKVSTVPLPSGSSHGSLIGVACVKTSSCFAAGSVDLTMGTAPLLEHWNGKRWRVLSAPTPSGAQTTMLTSVTCLSSSLCHLSGTWTDAMGVGHTLAERWNGHRWRVELTVDPSGVLASGLEEIACGSRSSCIGVGYSIPSPISGTHALAERFNGHKWSLTTLAGLSSSKPSTLFAVYAAQPHLLLAVGASGGSTLAEKWNGRSWSIVRSANQKGGRTSLLIDGSCYSPRDCVAAGNSSSTTSGSRAFLEELHPR